MSYGETELGLTPATKQLLKNRPAPIDYDNVIDYPRSKWRIQDYKIGGKDVRTKR